MNQYVYNARMAKEDNLAPDPTQELVVPRLLLWKCRLCGKWSWLKGGACYCTGSACFEQEEVELVEKASHQALEARLRCLIPAVAECLAIHALRTTAKGTCQCDICNDAHAALSAFNNQPTE